ncbi:hypothetical protein ACFWZ2_17280 [Streptomyces sp. NPDC059002]|uniref:hypothetical protein n=1 Tax=Streptomyces sp. NPDC059002 TaxID=3346690 RepID=UPI0036899412
MSVKDGTRRVWRVAMPIRVAAFCVASGFAVLGGITVWQWFTGPPEADMVLFAVLFLGGAIAGFLYCFATSVAITDDRVTVRNLGLVDWIPLSDIASVEAGYSGLTITAHDGRVVRGRAVEKPNYARWLGRRTRADRVVDEIRFASGLTVRGHRRGRAQG